MYLTPKRLPWVDWMKAIGMLFIIYGHMFSLYDKYVYAFNVPVFFVISGFLTNQSHSNRVFWRKLYNQLFLPMLLIASINCIIDIGVDILSHRFRWSELLFPLGIIVGDQTYLGACWYIYTLIILKIITQFITSTKIQGILCLLFIIVAVFICHVNLSIPLHNAYLSSLISYPFFLLGILSKRLEITNKTLTLLQVVIGIAILLPVLCFVADLNGSVKMYRLEYGQSIVLFLLGGIIGSSLIYIICRMFRRIWGGVECISKGSILILGFHMYIIRIYKRLLFEPRFDFLVSILILLGFIPIIRLVSRYFPILVGNKDVNNSSKSI